MIGLRYSRQLREDAYLYEVMALGTGVSSEPESVEEVLVIKKNSDTAPDQDKLWEVEPIGLTAGTNGFGAEVQIPTIRFWQYAKHIESDGTGEPN